MHYLDPNDPLNDTDRSGNHYSNGDSRETPEYEWNGWEKSTARDDRTDGTSGTEALLPILRSRHECKLILWLAIPLCRPRSPGLPLRQWRFYRIPLGLYWSSALILNDRTLVLPQGRQLALGKPAPHPQW